ncbi:hypothetical protein GUITHDRAFT_144629 [Guillardia theta CCMP2712]|uniref:Uncharacterized protein n=1 Tax=Guillardia theta (strain CCMP2712) TaxID=905079 RepID=L1IPX6_GUITC|nr:hypothetical protein GUITHDRAFT_144629 [Guillardia theta CCMP2712]EKX37944.1 hypothetical protein GUITHDRAFT_144629 [Guillardia theta CCMP2712]|eukprot:XP_005824924.1 hypothetical protein GUITHDRAFT_144629 [Guillardia theta CCMP2712]
MARGACGEGCRDAEEDDINSTRDGFMLHLQLPQLARSLARNGFHGLVDLDSKSQCMCQVGRLCHEEILHKLLGVPSAGFKGINCTFRLVCTKHKKKKTEGKVKEAQEGKSTDDQCKGVVKRVAMRTWFDGKSRGRHSNKRNELVCKCSDCGCTLLWGGSDPEFVQERRESADWTAGDNEKAEASMRIDQARSVINKEGLRAEMNQDTPSKRMLPPTLSARAEAAVDLSYGMHGKKFNSPGVISKKPNDKVGRVRRQHPNPVFLHQLFKMEEELHNQGTREVYMTCCKTF